MSELRLGLRENRTAYQPREEIVGAATWELDTPVERAAIHLLWFTRGKGTEDVEITDEIVFDAPQAGDTRTFSFQLPGAPYSFSGRLISLLWAVELVLEPGEDSAKVEFTMGPGGREVLITS